MLKVDKSYNCKNYLAIDACPSGWVYCETQGDDFKVSYVDSLSELLNHKNHHLFIDMPVILPNSLNEYPRSSDIKAKKYLGGFHASVFYAPLTEWLYMSYETINSVCTSVGKAKLSKQSYNLFPKIKEQQHFKQHFEGDVTEVHPELLIHYFLGKKKLSKKTKAGETQRLTVIKILMKKQIDMKRIHDIRINLKERHPKAVIKNDDIIDTIIVASVIEDLGTFKETYNTVNKEGLNDRFWIFK